MDFNQGMRFFNDNGQRGHWAWSTTQHGSADFLTYPPSTLDVGSVPPLHTWPIQQSVSPWEERALTHPSTSPQQTRLGSYETSSDLAWPCLLGELGSLMSREAPPPPLGSLLHQRSHSSLAFFLSFHKHLPFCL